MVPTNVLFSGSVLSDNVFVYLVEVTFLLEIWMFATLDICIVISDSKFHQTQLTASNALSSSACRESLESLADLIWLCSR